MLQIDAIDDGLEAIRTSVQSGDLIIGQGQKHLALYAVTTDHVQQAEADVVNAVFAVQHGRNGHGGIHTVQQALADSLVKLSNANPSEKVIQLKSLEAFAKAADGKSTKIIIPSEIQGLAGLAAGLKGIVDNDSPKQ